MVKNKKSKKQKKHQLCYLDSNMELGGLLGGARRFVDAPIQVHGHGEDGGVDRARLGEEAILQTWTDLVQPHQGIHWLVGVDGFAVEN